MPDLATPAPPAAPAPSAPAAAPSAPAPADGAPVAPVAPAAPASPAAPSAPAVPVTPAAYDPKTAAAPPKSSDFANDSEGLTQFIAANSAWSESHPEEAEKIRAAKVAAEDGTVPTVPTPESSVAEAVAAAEGKQPDDAAKPADAAVSAATPALIEEWTAKSPELKAAFEKSPELKAAVMETAREVERLRPIADIVGTPEEAQFAVEHAQRLVSLQTNWMLSGEDPEMVGPAWDQTVEMFKERDAQGNEVKGPDGKPKLGSDFKPFVRKAASSAMEEFTSSAQAQVAALEAKLAGSYPNEEARAADQELLDNAKYEKAAFEFVVKRLARPDERGTQLPTLPPNATPEQIAFQKTLKAEREELDAKTGKATAADRKAASKALDKEVQTTYEAGLNRYIETQVAAMKERGEYLPDFVLNDKWINPQTGQPTKVSAFGARIYLALNAKINDNPLHAAKLASLQALGTAGKEARLAEITRLQNLYLPKIFNAEVTRIQEGIRASSGKKPPVNTVARVEPQSQGTVVPQTMDASQVRSWAEGEAAKDPNFGTMENREREELIIKLAMKKRFGG